MKSEYGSVGKKLSILGILMLMCFVPIVYAESPDYELTFFSKWRMAVEKVSFSAYGELNGCSGQPDCVRSDLYISNPKSRKVADQFFSSSCKSGADPDNPGLINIYSLDGSKQKYIKEIKSDDYFYFSESGNYVIEYYECSVSGKKTTPDGYEHGDKICDSRNGYDSIIMLVANNPDDISKGYKWEKILDCKSGTDCRDSLSDCVGAKSDDYTRETHSGYSDTQKEEVIVKTTTDEDIVEMYDDLLSQIKDDTNLEELFEEHSHDDISETYNQVKLYNEEAGLYNKILDDITDNKDLSQDKITEYLALLSSMETIDDEKVNQLSSYLTTLSEKKKSLDDNRDFSKSDNVPGSFVVVIVIVLIIIIGGVVLHKRKRANKGGRRK